MLTFKFERGKNNKLRLIVLCPKCGEPAYFTVSHRKNGKPYVFKFMHTDGTAHTISASNPAFARYEELYNYYKIVKTPTIRPNSNNHKQPYYFGKADQIAYQIVLRHRLYNRHTLNLKEIYDLAKQYDYQYPMTVVYKVIRLVKRMRRGYAWRRVLKM